MRYQRQYGIHTYSDNSREQMHSNIASQLGGFKSQVAAMGQQVARNYAISKAEDESLEYNPEETPELREKNNAAAKVYNKRVLQAHQQAVDVRYKQRLIELADEYKDDPDSFEAASQKRLDMLKGELHPELHDRMPLYDHMRFVEAKKIRDGFIAQQEKEAIDTANDWASTTTETILRAIRNGEDDLALQEAEQFKVALLDSAAFDDDQKAEIAADLDRRALEAAITHDLDGMTPIQALESIEAQRGDIPEMFTVEEWDAFIKTSTTRQNARHATEKKLETDKAIDIGRQVGDISRAIKLVDESTDPDTLTSLYDSIETLYQQGMSDSKRESLLISLDEKQVEINQRQEALSSVLQRIDGDDSVVIDEGFIDDLWPSIEDSLSSEPLERNAAVADLSSKLGVIPKPVKSQLSNDLKSLDTDTLVDALDLMDRLQEYRNLPDQFSKQELAYAQKLESLLAYQPPEKAVELALQATSPDNPMAEGRLTWINDQKSRKKLDFAEMSEDAFDSWGVDLDDLNRFSLQKDFEHLTTSYYTAGMDFDAAKKQAERDMKTQWGKDALTGRFMKHPTQNYYAVNGKTDWVNRQLKREVSELGEYQKVYLTADDQTSREATVSRPSYLVWGVTEQGIEPIMMEGGQARFTPDIDSERKRVYKANQEKMEKARAEMETPLKAAQRRAERYKRIYGNAELERIQ